MIRLLTICGALTLTFLPIAAPAQTVAAGATQAQAVYIHTVNGKTVVDTGSAAPATACNNATSGLIWTNDVSYSLGDLVAIKLTPYCNIPTSGPGPVNITVQVTFLPWGGTTPVVGAPFPCDCGGANAGWLFTGLTAFEPVTVYSRNVTPDMAPGTYTYTVTLKDDVNGRTQTTTMVTWVLATNTSARGPFSISYVGVPTATGIQVYGQFPKNVPMYYMWGVPAFEGGLNTVPSPMSADGKSLFVPVAMDTGDSIFNGSIVLMTPGPVNTSTIARNRFTF